MFFFWGLLSGLLATALMIVVNEYYERTAPSVSEIASELSIPYMGSLPKVAWGELTFMKGAKSSPKKPRKRLEEWN